MLPIRVHTGFMSSKEVLPIDIKAVLPTATGSAVFLGNEKKVFVIYMDPLVGNAISLLIHGTKNERPLTHDLMGLLLTSLGARVERVIINDLKGATYYGRMIITVENELQQRKVIELDARPSDCLAMASQQKAPIYVTRGVWDEAEDMSGVLKKLSEENEEKNER
jgi:bifunctional DNase/RNase